MTQPPDAPPPSAPPRTAPKERAPTNWSAVFEDVRRHGYEEYQQYVNPLIYNRAQIAQEKIYIDTALDDGRLQDRDGNIYEDFHGIQTFGHRIPEVDAALAHYVEHTRMPVWFPARVSPYAGRLAKTLCERTGYERVSYGMSGSDGIEAAIKLARAYHFRPDDDDPTKGTQQKPGIVTLTGAYHGCNVGSTALMNEGLFRKQFAPFLPGVIRVDMNDVAGLERAFAEHDVGCMFVEPVQVEGGVHAMSPEFITAACALTAEHDALLFVDEVQTGMGRTGTELLYSPSVFDRRPDGVILAKALGGGLLPLSALLTRADVFDRAYGQNFASGESHNMSFGFYSPGMVCGLAALEIMDDDYIAGIKTRGDHFRRLLDEHIAPLPLVEEIRGVGLIVGVALKDPDHPWLSFEHFGFPELKDQSPIAPLVCTKLYDRGFICFSCGHDWRVLRIQPRANIPLEALDRFVDELKTVLTQLEELT